MPLVAMMLCLLVACATADPDARDGMPEALPASGVVSGTLLPGAGKRTHFAVVGDYGYIGAGAEAVAGMIRSWEPQFIITTGDNIYGPVDYYDLRPGVPGVQTGWDEYVGRYYGEWIQKRADGRYESLTGTLQRFFPCVGNHEHTLLSGIVTHQPPPLPEENYRDFFHLNPGGAPRLPVDRGAVHTNYVSYYALRKGPVDFFVMDSNQPFLNSSDGLLAVADQNAWLEREAAASKARWKLAVFHHPPPRPWQVPWNWIPPARMALCDAVLAGHYHVYERLLWNEVPVIVTGNGGAPYHQRFQPFFPDTLAVDDRHYGALKVQAGEEYLEFESRSLDAVTGDEILAERFVLGDAAAIPDMEDEYVFHAVEGEAVTLEAETPGSELDAALTLYGPDGRVAARAAAGARLSAALTKTGRWKVRVSAETDAPGGYLLRARLQSPGTDYAGWLAEQLRETSGTPDDVNGDGIANVVAYALTPYGYKLRGAALEVAAVPGVSVVRLPAPQPMRQGVTLAIETATSPQGVWTVVAERKPFGDWRSPVNLALNVGAVNDGRQTVQVVVNGGTKRFYRLRVTLTQ